MSQGVIFVTVNFCDSNFALVFKILFNIPDMVSDC